MNALGSYKYRRCLSLWSFQPAWSIQFRCASFPSLPQTKWSEYSIWTCMRMVFITPSQPLDSARSLYVLHRQCNSTVYFRPLRRLFSLESGLSALVIVSRARASEAVIGLFTSIVSRVFRFVGFSFVALCVCILIENVFLFFLFLRHLFLASLSFGIVCGFCFVFYFVLCFSFSHELHSVFKVAVSCVFSSPFGTSWRAHVLLSHTHTVSTLNLDWWVLVEHVSRWVVQLDRRCPTTDDSASGWSGNEWNSMAWLVNTFHQRCRMFVFLPIAWFSCR